LVEIHCVLLLWKYLYFGNFQQNSVQVGFTAILLFEIGKQVSKQFQDNQSRDFALDGYRAFFQDCCKTFYNLWELESRAGQFHQVTRARHANSQ